MIRSRGSMAGLVYLCCMKRLFFGCVIPFALALLSYKPELKCEVKNEVFSTGEEIRYQALYNWGFIWLEAGEVVFKVNEGDHQGRPAYHITGVGGSYPSYDWIYKVRDRFETWLDTNSFRPYRYIRDVNEGGRTFYNECFFNNQKSKAYCITREKKKQPRLDTVPFSECALDPMAMIYYARTLDFSKCKINDTLPIELFLDNKIYKLYIRYLGKENFKIDKTTYRCIKFSPKLVEGTIFKGGEGMVVWATDDQNRIPLFVEAPILVGTIKAKILSWKGLKYKFEARLN